MCSELSECRQGVASHEPLWAIMVVSKADPAGSLCKGMRAEYRTNACANATKCAEVMKIAFALIAVRYFKHECESNIEHMHAVIEQNVGVMERFIPPYSERETCAGHRRDRRAVR